MLLENKNSIITGCNRGIGKKILQVFAKNGSNIWACARKPDNEFLSFINECANEYDVQIWPVFFDLQDFNQIRLEMKKIISSKKPIDILVNNAGITYNALFQMANIEKIQEVFEVNYFSQIIITQYILKVMVRNKKGSIINISSSAGVNGASGRSIYGASKAAVICATKSLAKEVGETGIRVNSIAPGITETEMLSNMSETVLNEEKSRTHLKRFAETSEIANTCLFLGSELSNYITGQVIRVDGGMN